MTTEKLTIREIRKKLFTSNKYSVIGITEMTNKKSREFLYSKKNQNKKMYLIENKTHFLIY